MGVHCVDCAKANRVAPTRTVAGAVVRGGPPRLTQGLLLVLAVVYVAQLVVPGTTGQLGFSPFISRAEPWRFLSLGLVHSPGLPFHLVFNGFALWVFGRELEGLLGRLRYGAVLLVSTLASAVGVLWLTPVDSTGWTGLTVGASGAVFGLLGTAVVLDARRGRQVVRQLVVLVLFAAAGFLVPGISWQGHVGGLLGGLAVSAVLLLAPGRRQRLQVLGVLAVLAMLAALTVLRWALVPASLLV